MKVLLNPVPLVALASSVALALLGQFAIAGIVFIAWFAMVALVSMRSSNEIRRADVSEELDPESRILLTPVRKLVDSIEETVRANAQSITMKTVGEEVLSEARRIKDQSAKALLVRRDIKRFLRGKSVAELAIADLQTKIAEAKSLPEKDALQSALAARELEVSHYAKSEEALGDIDSGINQAQAVLSEMKTRISLGAMEEKTAASSTEDIRETIGRLRGLSLAFDEAEEMVQSLDARVSSGS